MARDDLVRDRAPLDRIQPKLAARVLLFAVAGFVLLFLIWAAFAELDEVTRGDGRVIPSRQLQVVQNLEGGIVRAILIRQGQEVKRGDVLLRLDNTQFSAEFLRGQEGYNTLVAKITRLEAEAQLGIPIFPEALTRAAPDIVTAEMALFNARQGELQARLNVAQSKLAQAQQALGQAQVEEAVAAQARELAKTEVGMIRPLVEKGIEPRIELLRAEGKAAQADGEANVARLAAQRARSAVGEAQAEADAIRQTYRAQAVSDLAEAKGELAGMGRALPALKDRVSRTDVTAPIGGVVQRVLVATVGGVVKPGEPLVEIVPKDDSLVVEAQIKPADIAFIRPGQEALVKITAYDFSTYGGLSGRVEYISPDAVKDERTGLSHYIIRVRTDKAALTSDKGPLPITAGMVAQVDVLNGKRSVLDYILSPLEKVQDEALRES
jgi:membrane fusion protein, adhesin transport system